MMSRTSRVPFVRRAVAAAVTGLHVVLVVGATGHAGDHAAPGLEDLPVEFHDHAFEWTGGAPDGVDAHEACVACHLQRTGLDLPGLGSPGAAEPPDGGAPALAVVRPPGSRASHPEPIRGPPPFPSA